MNGDADHTKGGLGKKDILEVVRKDKVRYVSRVKSEMTRERYEDGSFRNDEWIAAIKKAAAKHKGEGLSAPEIAKKAKPIYRRMKAGRA